MRVINQPLTENVLQAISDLDIQHYQLNTCIEKTEESFYVKKDCTLRRNKQTEKCDVTIFHDFEEDGKLYRGSSSFIADGNLSPEALRQKISDAYRCAAYVKNPYYKLPASDSTFIAPKDSPAATDRSLFAQANAADTACGCSTAAKFTADEIAGIVLAASEMTDTGALINSLEVFLTEKSIRIINSNGIHVHYDDRIYSGEYVVQAKEPQDVELYYDFAYTDTDDIPSLLKSKVEKSLRAIADRAGAVPVDTVIPADSRQSLPYENIILEGACVYDLFYYYLRRLDASMIYPKYSHYQLGDSIVKNPAETSDTKNGTDCSKSSETEIKSANNSGIASETEAEKTESFDKISIDLLPKTPYSSEGIRMTERCLIKDNEVRLITGNARFSHYLGLPATGMYSSYRLACGKTSLQEMEQRPYLKIVHFSDFQMDELTGQFGGEYRLAYYFDGEKTVAVTNGSFSGNINDYIDRLTLSSQRQSFYHFDGPLAVALSVLI